jgi:hypothetical protein
MASLQHLVNAKKRTHESEAEDPNKRPDQPLPWQYRHSTTDLPMASTALPDILFCEWEDAYTCPHSEQDWNNTELSGDERRCLLYALAWSGYDVSPYIASFQKFTPRTLLYCILLGGGNTHSLDALWRQDYEAGALANMLRGTDQYDRNMEIMLIINWKRVEVAFYYYLGLARRHLNEENFGMDPVERLCSTARGLDAKDQATYSREIAYFLAQTSGK